ncbi:hypothetical protein [Leptospirillum ferriphilum]|uniref:hypothetical protein n=1 Tax=Leptospirillum ferriphilum TaxID=178606 RepID=UPI0006B15523|nr:hypothetical protein [Leptospirillum ferriphilum]
MLSDFDRWLTNSYRDLLFLIFREKIRVVRAACLFSVTAPMLFRDYKAFISGRPIQMASIYRKMAFLGTLLEKHPEIVRDERNDGRLRKFFGLAGSMLTPERILDVPVAFRNIQDEDLERNAALFLENSFLRKEGISQNSKKETEGVLSDFDRWLTNSYRDLLFLIFGEKIEIRKVQYLFGITHLVLVRDFRILSSGRHLRMASIYRKMAFLGTLLEKHPEIVRDERNDGRLRKFFGLAGSILTPERILDVPVAFRNIQDEDLERNAALFLENEKKGKEFAFRFPKDLDEELRKETESRNRSFHNIIEESILRGLRDQDVLENSSQVYRVGRARKLVAGESRSKPEKVVFRHIRLNESTEHQMREIVQEGKWNAFVLAALRKRYNLHDKSVGLSHKEIRLGTPRVRRKDDLLTIHIRIDADLKDKMSALAKDRFGKLSPAKSLWNVIVKDYFWAEGWKNPVSGQKSGSEREIKSWVIPIDPETKIMLHRQAKKMNVDVSSLCEAMMRWWAQKHQPDILLDKAK